MHYKIKLKELRIEKNLSQKEVAQILGIARQTYNHYEVQENIIPINYLIFLSDYYNVAIDYIFNLTTEKQYLDINKEIDMKTAGLRLKEFRKNYKVTQEKLAILVNTNRSVLANYERGRNYIATPFLYTICKTYNISADYLLGKINYNPIQ